MKKPAIIAILLIVVISVSMFNILQHKRKIGNGRPIYEATQTAFVKLDAKIIKCTASKFLLNVNLNTDKPIAPLFKNLGDLSFTITTKDNKAQKFFNQGLRLTYAFNHAEAHRSFLEASRIDSTCAMAYWGQAYALGPNINDPIPDDERKKLAYEASQKAVELSVNSTAVEQQLIKALTKRYSNTNTDLAALNKSYMDAMGIIASAFEDNPDVLTLYAAAVMNTTPWNYWDGENNPMPGVERAQKALETAFNIDNNHPGAHHYYIHLVELPYPDLAVPSAERLGDLMPGAGHLVHMPSHIFIRIGRYEEAALSNIKAVAADEDYISQCYSQGLYPLAYYPHNIHFLWSSSSFMGNSATAISAAKKTAEKVPIGEMGTLHFLQDYASTPMLAYVRFGRWNDILTIPYPGDQYKHLALIWHYARGIAFIRKHNLNEAQEELEALASLTKDRELEQIIANYTNPSSGIAKVAHKVVSGELAAAQGDFQNAISELEAAVAFEDELVYSEPTAWHVPTRQTLGAVLLSANQPEKAESVFKEDLKINRNNGWSLKGLEMSLKAQGKNSEAEKTKATFEQVWSKADIVLDRAVL